MTFRTLVVLIIALVVGLFAAVLVQKQVSHLSNVAEEATMVQVVAAKRYLYLESIQKDDIKPLLTRKELLPADYYEWPRIADDADDKVRKIYEQNLKLMYDRIVGRWVDVAIEENAAVKPTSLAPKANEELRIEEGMRGITIDLPSVSAGVGGFIVPGSRVDIFATSNSGLLDQSSTRAILQNVKVIAVDNRTGAEERSSADGSRRIQSVTLLLDRADVPKLIHHQITGALTLALRKADEKIHPPPELERKLFLVQHSDPEKLVKTLRKWLQLNGDPGAVIADAASRKLLAVGSKETFALIEEALTYFDVTTPGTSPTEAEPADKLDATVPATAPQ